MKNKKAKSKEKRNCCISLFVNAPEDKRFVLADGRVLKNVKELSDALEHMGDDVFRTHVNNGKNDFSSWVRDVLNEQELADDMLKADDQLNTQLVVLRQIAKKVF